MSQFPLAGFSIVVYHLAARAIQFNPANHTSRSPHPTKIMTPIPNPPRQQNPSHTIQAPASKDVTRPNPCTRGSHQFGVNVSLADILRSF